MKSIITKKIGEFAEVITGGTPSTHKKEYWENGTIPWINSGALKGIVNKPSKYITDLGLKNCSAKLMPPDTVLIALTGATTGDVGYLTINSTANQSVTGILPSIHHNPKYLYYYLRTLNKKIKGDAFGGAQQHINQRYVKDIRIPLPTLEMQKHIAKILEEVNQIIELRQQSIQKHDELLQSVFYHMFLKDYEKCAWPEAKIMEMASNESGSMRTGPFGSDLLHSEFVDEGIAVIGIDNVVTNKFVWNNSRFVTPQKYERLKRYTLFPQDIVITIMGTLGKCAVIPEDIPPMINTKHLAAVTLNKQIANPTFISYAFTHHPIVLHQLKSKTKGAIMGGLNLGIIKNIHFKLPPIELQLYFENRAKLISTQRSNLENSLDRMNVLFQSLVHQSFSGEAVTHAN